LKDQQNAVEEGPGTPPPETQRGLSRRDFIRLNLALIALAGTPACTGPRLPPDGRRIIRLLRADDLLSLQVELVNLEIVDRRDRTTILWRADSARDAFLVVRFPGQHIAEQAFDEADDSQPTLPAKAGIARPSQLVFRLPRSVDAIDLTLAALLEWQDLELQAPDDASVITSSTGQRTTRIELPTGLALAPDDGVAWRHAVNPVRHNGRVELWHTRLLGTDPASAARMLIQTPGYLPQTSFPTALEQDDRDHLVGKQADAHTLILSPMGGWLDIRGRWEPAAGPDITRWEHRATAGQDQKVVLEYNDGFLYPFGHRATIVSVTERRLEPATGNGTDWRPQTAVLRKRNFIVVKAPTSTYDHGGMTFETITVESVVTPALHIDDKFADAFWIETAPGKPFPFQFSANDWDRSELTFEAAAVFVQDEPKLETAASLYAYKGYQQQRQIALRGQAAAVARYQPETPTDEALPGDVEKEARSAGNTTLHLLLLELAGSSVPLPDGDPPFTCRTEAMEVRLPALEPYLDNAINRGWFRLRDPDEPDNKGEVFAIALPERSRPIPMYFDRQADLAGGLAAPSFDVDGLSRIHGPVGNAKQVADGAGISLEGYFAGGQAFLLGGFPLIPLIAAASAGKSPAIPKIEYILSRKQPSGKPKPDPKPDPKPAPEKGPGEESNKKDDEPAYWEAGIGLSWKIPLGTAQDQSEQDSKPRVAFEAIRDEDGQSTCALEIGVKATRRIGGATRPKQQKPADGTAQKPKPDDGAGKSGTDLSASGKLKNFALALNLNDTDGLRIRFDHLSVKLGPPKKPKDKTDNKDTDKDASGDKEDQKNDKARFEPEIEFKLARIEASGALAFIEKVIEAATKIPLPSLPAGEEPSGAYPAKLPDKGDADLSVTLGPFEAPKFKLLQFEVSRVSATLGIGLNFLPRPGKDGEEPSVPDHVFSIRVASADKPLTLVAAPWGGIAHLGLNFTTKQLTAFQYSMGVIYKAEFDLALTKATCEGSLAAMFTYTAKEPPYQVDLILKLSGQTKLWFMDIHILLVTVGSWKNHVWSFDALLAVRVQIGFFTVKASYGLHYTIADQRKQG
jgi:hypothetical protein